MLSSSQTKKTLTSFVLAIFMSSQVLLVFAIMLSPRSASAQLMGEQPIPSVGITGFYMDPTVLPTSDLPTVWERVTVAIGQQIALRFTEYFVNKYVNKLLEKYRIRNFLYYDQVLSDYYLNRFIQDKIKDPNLYNIYAKLEYAYVSGQPTGATNAPDPRKALIPQIKKRIYDLYVQEGGVPTSTITSPPSNLTDADYFALASLYFLHPPESTESNLRAGFMETQTQAEASSSLELETGQGLKSARDITNAVGAARSFVTNPSTYVQTWLKNVIKVKAKYSFDPNDFWTSIGSALGNFLWSQFNLDKSSGVLSDDPDNYVPEDNDNNPPSGTPIDIDGDGSPDGYDYDGDGQLDICTFGGVTTGTAGPPCKGSQAAMLPPEDQNQGGPNPNSRDIDGDGKVDGLDEDNNGSLDICYYGGANGGSGPPCLGSVAASIPPDALTRHPDQSALVAQIKSDLEAQGVDLSGSCGGFEITKRVAWALAGEGAGLSSGNDCNGYKDDIIMYTDGYNYDILSGTGTANGPQWLPQPLLNTSLYVPAFEP
jgi:hypothetical protein